MDTIQNKFTTTITNSFMLLIVLNFMLFLTYYNSANWMKKNIQRVLVYYKLFGNNTIAFYLAQNNNTLLCEN